jgi:hypothetical protein
VTHEVADTAKTLRGAVSGEGKVTLSHPRLVCGAQRFTRLLMFGRAFNLDPSCQAYLG